MWNIEHFRELLAAIVNMDSGSRYHEGIAQVADFLTEQLKQMGFFVEEMDDHTKIQAQTHQGDQFDALFIGHMDTVFPKGTASARPYTEKNGFAYGPGVIDMKSGLLLAMFLAERIKHDRPDFKICMAFNSDEEIGSASAIDWFQNLTLKSKYVFVFEPGRVNNGFIRSRKGNVDLAVTFRGIASHAGTSPEKGANAIVEMARWITELTALQDLSVGTSVSADMAKGGTAVNVIAEYAELNVDIRVRQPEELDRIKEAVRQLKDTISVPGVIAEYEFLNETMPMNPSESTKKLMKVISDTGEELGQPVSWEDSGGMSDANHVAMLGIPTICGCGPFGSELHSDREYMELDSIAKRLDMMYGVLMKL